MKELIEKLESFEKKIIETRKILRLDEKKIQLEALEYQMNSSDFWDDQEEAKKISQEFSGIHNELATWESFQKEISNLLDVALTSQKEGDESLKEEIEKKFFEFKEQFEKLEFFILFSGKYDENSAIVAIHAGTGGVDAQDWAEMLLRMILRFCENHNLSTRILDESRGNEAGLKSVVFEVIGHYAYGWLRSEHGVHRLVRISPFDAENMRHTSFALIEVLPEVDHLPEIAISDEDLRVDVFRAGGHGGQSVNTTDSAVRITHLPTGIVVTCQNERSQYANKRSAIKILKAKLHRLHEQNIREEKEKLRGEYFKAEWGNQIRSYVLHPYKMVKDLRTRHETSNPDVVLEGNIESFIEAYLRWDREKQR